MGMFVHVKLACEVFQGTQGFGRRCGFRGRVIACQVAVEERVHGEGFDSGAVVGGEVDLSQVLGVVLDGQALADETKAKGRGRRK